MDEILCDIHDDIALVTMNRPSKMNAINQSMRDGFAEIFRRIELDSDVRVVVLRGAGTKAFSAGADMNEVSQWDPYERRTRFYENPINTVRRCQKPVIAMIQGYALGGGLELGLACDIRLAAETAVFALPEVGLGWLPAGGGTTQLLPRMIGLGEAMLMILTGERIDAQTAHRIGLVQRVWPIAELEMQGMNIASQITRHNPRVVMLAKAAVRMAFRSPLDVGIEYEKELSTMCFLTESRDAATETFTKNKNS